jgi:hypothetical protein
LGGASARLERPINIGRSAVMTTTREEIEAAINGRGAWRFHHVEDPERIYVALEIVQMRIGDDEWEDGVRYREHGDGGRGRAYVRTEWSFCERFTRVP